jgi:hypothetical protein
VGGEPRAEEERGDGWVGPAVAVAQGAHAGDEAAYRNHPPDVLGRVHVEVPAQLVVQERQREERQERRQDAQPELAAQGPQAGGEPGRGHPQERAHRRQRRAPEEVRRPGVEAVQDELGDRGRVQRAPLERLTRHLAGVGQLEPVGPVPPRAEHLEVEKRRAPQPDDGDRQEDDEPGGQGHAVLGQLLAHRLQVLSRPAPPLRHPPQREGDGQERQEEPRSRQDVADRERGRRQPHRGVAEPERERDPGREACPGGRVQGQHRAGPRHQHEPQGRAEGRWAHSYTTQSSPAMSQTVGSSKNEL